MHWIRSNGRNSQVGLSVFLGSPGKSFCKLISICSRSSRPPTPPSPHLPGVKFRIYPHCHSVEWRYDVAETEEMKVPTTFNEMLLFNASVMGYGSSTWMNIVLQQFDDMVACFLKTMFPSQVALLRVECGSITSTSSNLQGQKRGQLWPIARGVWCDVFGARCLPRTSGKDIHWDTQEQTQTEGEVGMIWHLNMFMFLILCVCICVCLFECAFNIMVFWADDQLRRIFGHGPPLQRLITKVLYNRSDSM